MSAYQVGKFYLVPCVYGRVHRRDRWWPVLGQFHEDAEHIDFDIWHWHLDARFLSRRDLEYIGSPNDVAGTAAARRWVLHLRSGDLPRGQGNFTKADHPRPLLKRIKCRRQWDDSEFVDRARWIPGLESAYGQHRFEKGICPHRGADLSTLPIDAQGCIECPLHGLRWHVESGRMVPRAEWRRRNEGLARG